MNESSLGRSAVLERMLKDLHLDQPLPIGLRKKSDEPVRLIDVCSTIDGTSKGTICFKAGAGRGWDFHVISHTWSLDVRKLSETIGKEVGLKAQAPGGTDAYSEAFKQADFSHQPCYKRLIELLQLLVVEGVKEIWFDALCINQVDNKEKDREIQNMGSYYGESRGCYAIAHGLGEGFKLWGENGGLARWFTRVWTFQEFMLPQRLAFIVEGLDLKMIAYVNREINAKRKKGLCRCFLMQVCENGKKEQVWGSALNAGYWEFLAGGAMKIKHLLQGLDTGDETLVSCNIDELCAECESAPMIRKAHTPNYMNGAAQLYVVDREAYLGVMQFDFELFKFRGDANALVQATVNTLCGLYNKFLKASLNHTWTLRNTIAEVRTRDCSVKEDRVLGILALLGIELLQVRSGKGLETQLVELAKACDSEMLAELCMMDAKPCSIVGMSWAPDLLNTMVGDHISTEEYDYGWQSYINGWNTNPYLDVECEKLHVSDIGSIQISAKVVAGMVLPISALPIALIKEGTLFYDCHIWAVNSPPTHFLVVPILQCSYNHTNPNFEQLDTPLTPSSLSYISMDSCCFLPLDLHITQMSTSCGSMSFLLKFLPHWLTDGAYAGKFELPIVIMDNSLDFKQLEVSFQVKMVVLGNLEGGQSRDLLTKIIMVCLSNTIGDGREEELHKIGMLSLQGQTTKVDGEVGVSIFTKASRRKCLIGGFGPNLNDHVTLEQGKKVDQACDHFESS